MFKFTNNDLLKNYKDKLDNAYTRITELEAELATSSTKNTVTANEKEQLLLQQTEEMQETIKRLRRIENNYRKVREKNQRLKVKREKLENKIAELEKKIRSLEGKTQRLTFQIKQLTQQPKTEQT